MRLGLLILALVFAVPSRARTHKTFPADSESVSRENERADALGYGRFENQAGVEAAVDSGELVSVPIRVASKLPRERRYVRQPVADFMLELDTAFHTATGGNLVVDSAVRSADVQQRLCRSNRSAAPATGLRASSHERGTTFDLSRHMARRDYRWLLTRLMYYRATGRILVIEERNCLHIFVGGRYVCLPTGTFSHREELTP